jgi:hypothetical protein
MMLQINLPAAAWPFNRNDIIITITQLETSTREEKKIFPATICHSALAADFLTLYLFIYLPYLLVLLKWPLLRLDSLAVAHCGRCDAQLEEPRPSHATSERAANSKNCCAVNSALCGQNKAPY